METSLLLPGLQFSMDSALLVAVHMHRMNG
jgi:hypothetical protein